MSNLRALFFTTTSNECVNHALSWADVGELIHKTFGHGALINNDWQLLEYIQEHKPDVVFYIGACSGSGVPRPSTLIQARGMVPLISIVSDAGDAPWHPVMKAYRRRGCFDVQVAIDGVKGSPADLVTLTPVSHKLFAGQVTKDVRCGFSGTLGNDVRTQIVRSLEWFADLQVRNRTKTDGYPEHIAFLKRCQMTLNVSFNGSSTGHHIKGRVIEAGLAECCLLEHVDSPIADWFPSDCYISYRTPKDAAQTILRLGDATIQETAARLHHEVTTRFTPEIIYRSILSRVDITQSRTPI